MQHLILFLASSSCHFVSSSIQNYNPYNYDLTTPMFTPDGRLMQVEYASQATSRSSPLIVLPFASRDNNEHGIVIGTRLSSSSSEHSTELSSSSSDKQKPPTIQKKTGQRRIIELPIGSHNTGQQSLTPSSTGGVVIGLSGVLSDNVALLNEAMKHLQSWYKSYGIYPPHYHHHGTTHRHRRESSVVSSGTVAALRVAHIIGDACQKNSFGGGIRPYGAATVVCGVDKDDIAIFCTHPSGSVLKVATRQQRARDDASLSKNKNAAFVIGGDVTAHRRINNKITTFLESRIQDESSLGNSHVDKSVDGTTTTTKGQTRPIDAVKAVITALLTNDDDNRRPLSSKNNGSSSDDSRRRRRQGMPPLDILVLTSRGAHRLDDEYIASLISQIET